MQQLYPNCKNVCLTDNDILKENFSSKILKESLVYNYYFGMILGIFMNRDNVF